MARRGKTSRTAPLRANPGPRSLPRSAAPPRRAVDAESRPGRVRRGGRYRAKPRTPQDHHATTEIGALWVARSPHVRNDRPAAGRRRSSVARSEERRVGKEWRARWVRDWRKKKT